MLSMILNDIVVFYILAWTIFAGGFSVNTGNELGPFVRSGSVFLQGMTSKFNEHCMNTCMHALHIVYVHA
jgi:hypothetical protein